MIFTIRTTVDRIIIKTDNSCIHKHIKESTNTECIGSVYELRKTFDEIIEIIEKEKGIMCVKVKISP